ncbi:unnamed protein product [Rodentolepis nana]|uniref:Shugoshin C-terminal domain-containing protein n=1 Tax=Rodentolepis nana TaxID=102285 RepID=A0A0R3TGU8_RODNA|nr:unnamed protein product [Rodentolepis nana]
MNSKVRSLAPPPPNRPLPPIPTAEQEEAAQRKASPTILTIGNTHNHPVIISQRKKSQPMEGSKSINQTPNRKSPAILTPILSTSPLTVQQIPTQTQTNRRSVPRMGTKSHPRGVQQPSDPGENGIESRLSPNVPEFSVHSTSSSSSGCEDSTLGSRRINSEDYMKITSDPCLFNVNPGFQNQDSDDGYTSLNALDNIKKRNQKCLTKKKSSISNARRPLSNSSSSISSATSFDDESTLVCINEDSNDSSNLPADGMYRLKVKSTTSPVNSGSQFHGNKRLVRKYRAKRREMGTHEPPLPKTVSLDRDHRRRITTSNSSTSPTAVNKEKTKQQNTRDSPCRLVTMLVV